MRQRVARLLTLTFNISKRNGALVPFIPLAEIITLKSTYSAFPQNIPDSKLYGSTLNHLRYFLTSIVNDT